MNLATMLAERSTCKRMSVGCVITTIGYERVLSIGYNGNAKGLPNTCDTDEPGKCGCIHAEANAIIKCSEPYTQKVVFCTHQPCPMCAKQIINLGNVKKVIFKEPYRVLDGIHFLQRSGIEVMQIDKMSRF